MKSSETSKESNQYSEPDWTPAEKVRMGIDSDSGEYGLQEDAHAALNRLLEQLEAAETEREQAYATAQAMNEAQFEASVRVTELKEQLETLENASRSIAYLNDDGLCWCDEWYHAQDPTTGEQRDVTEHQEACRRLRGLVSNPASEPKEA